MLVVHSCDLSCMDNSNGQHSLTHFVLHVHRLVQEEKKKREGGYIYTNIYIYTYIEIRCIFFVCEK